MCHAIYMYTKIHGTIYSTYVSYVPLLEILEEGHERGLRGGVDGAVVHTAVVHRTRELRRLGLKRSNENERYVQNCRGTKRTRDMMLVSWFRWLSLNSPPGRGNDGGRGEYFSAGMGIPTIHRTSVFFYCWHVVECGSSSA